MGGRKAWAMLVIAALVVTACSDTTPDPTLAPGTTATSTTAGPTTTEAPTTTEGTTTTATVVTTTEDPDARRAEIEALVGAAVIGRLQAIHDKDADTLLHWVGSQAKYDDALDAMDRNVYLQRPSIETFAVSVLEVLLDRPDCVVTIDTVTVGSGVIEGFDGGSSTNIGIWWPADDGRFLHGAVWAEGTPQFQWIEECDIALRGVTP